MIAALPSTVRPAWLSLWWQLAAVLWLGAGPIAAQPTRPPTERQSREVHITASERCLWLVVVNGSESRLFFRETEADFDSGRSTRRQIVAQTALNHDLLVFFDDGAFYRYSPAAKPPIAESVLPQRETPLEMVGGNGRIYAIVSSAAAAELPMASTDEPEAAPQAFDPGESAYSLVVFDGRSWSAMAALPTLVRPPNNARLRSRLCLVHDKLLLLVPGELPEQLHQFYLDLENREWRSREQIRVPRLADFQVVNFSRVPTLVTVLRGATQGEELGVFRLLGDVARADTTSWQPAKKLQLSDLPEDVAITRYTDAVGFNQHLGLLAWTADGEAYLRFARLDNPPAERTISVGQVLAKPGVLRRSQGLLQGITFVLLLAVLTGLFVFRRGSMIRVVELPPGCALALNVQRLAAWLIDFVPFSIAAAAAVGLPWGEGLGSLGRWGISPNPESGLPEERVLLWWGLSATGHTAYSLVMELIAGRTVGKVITRVRLISEAGTHPTAGQMLARNLTRLIELMPQFWVFVVLVILSRNRQRMGDIFARTVAIRLLPRKPTPPTKDDGNGAPRESGDGGPAEKHRKQTGPSDPDQE